MKDTTTASRSERRDVWLALAAGGLAGIVYLLTVAHGVYPGQSASLMAVCTGLEPTVAPMHPIWSAIAGWIGRVHVLSLPLRLNLFSVLCGAAAVGLLCRQTAFLVRQTIHEDSIADRQIDRAAAVAGLTAAAALAFSVPFWSASTRLQYQGFDLLILLGLFQVLVLFVRTGLTVFLLAFALGYGVGIVETTLFILLLPVAAVLVVLALVKRRRFDLQTLSLFGLAGIAGLCAYPLFAWSFFQGGDKALRGYRNVMDVLVFMWRDQYHIVRGAIPRVGWMWLLFQSAVPSLAAFIAARRALNNERSWSLYLLHAILTGVAVCVLTNVPFAPWRLVRLGGTLPVGTYAMMAMVTGYLAAYWHLMMSVRERRHDQQISNLTRRAGNWMGLVLAWPLTVLVAVAAVVNGFEANGARGAGADLCARRLLDDLRGRSWIVTDGTLDNHIEILARERGQTVHLLCLQKDTDRIYQRQLVRLIEKENLFPSDRQRMLNSLDIGVLPFIQDWFASDTNIASKAVVFGVPDLWYGAGQSPLPEYLFFGGTRGLEGRNGPAMAADHMAFWNVVTRALPRRPRTTDPTSLLCNYLRRHVGFVGNNLGVTLEEMGRTNEAAAVYARVREIDPDNISALFNQFEMARRGTDEALKTRIEKEVRDFIARQKHQYALWSLSRYYGYVRSPELFARLGWSWALSGQTQAGLAGIKRADDLLLTRGSRLSLQQTIAAIYMLQDERAKSEDVYRQILANDPENRQAILSIARIAVASGELDKARNWLQKVQDVGVARNQLGVEYAAVHLAAGEFDLARVQLQETVDTQPNNLQALGMLAVVLLQQNNIKEVEQTVLPKMEAVAGSPDQYFIQIVRAQAAMAKGKDFFRVARAAFIRASILRPDVTRLSDVILQLDIALVDQPRAEQHARQVLRVNRRHALANYVMGSLRLQAGQYGEAEDYLRRSVTTEPLPAALNDLSETLRRMRKFVDAETFARDAVAKAPELYIGYETLAAILMDQSRIAEAEPLLDKALKLNKDDMRVQMSRARLLYLKGDLTAARDAIKIVRGRQGELNPYELDEFERLAGEISRRR
jgi:tetratricopeptide (TPR) repeat protein